MGAERRRTERLKANLFAQLRSTADNSEMGRAVVIDVSLGGLALETQADLKEGYIYECDVEIPLTFKAKVMRSLAPGQLKRYGLKFMGQSFIDKMLLRKLLKGKKTSIKV